MPRLWSERLCIGRRSRSSNRSRRSIELAEPLAAAAGLVVDLLELLLDARPSSRRATSETPALGVVTTLERARTKNLPRRAR